MEKDHLSGISSAETDELSALTTNFWLGIWLWYINCTNRM